MKFSRRSVLRGGIAATLLGCFVVALPSLAGAQTNLRIATWNVTDYTGDRVSDFQTSLYGTFNGRSMSPDVLVGQEFASQSAVTSFLNILNTAPGSPGDWKAAPFHGNAINYDTNNGFFYRASKVTYLATTLVANGGSSTSDQPRSTYRYDLRVGADPNGPLLDIYSVHLKAGFQNDASGNTTNGNRRLLETQRIRANAATLNANINYLVAGDYNIGSSNEAAYQALVGSTSGEAGRVFDPIDSPGTWNNNSAFRYLHTQDQTSQLDDRFDQLLISRNLFDGKGLDYVGNPFLPYSTTTFNDPNHSYRVWGNDGSSYNTTINRTSNTEVGNTIATALYNSVGSANLGSNGGTGGHLPVYADFRVAPVPEPGLIASLSFGLGAFGVRLLSRKRRDLRLVSNPQ